MSTGNSPGRARYLNAAILAATLTVALWAVAGPSVGAERASTPPGENFYIWDGELPERPGTLLRRAALPDEMRLSGAGEHSRILYASTGGTDAAPTAVSGMLFVPEGAAPEGGWPLLAWAHGTRGLADHCAPSRTGVGAATASYLEAWLDAGYAVVATDYEGLGTPGLHPYLVKRAEGYGVLDSVRAARDAHEGIGEAVVISGQSQGAGAVIAAAGLAPDYAPEIDIAAVLATGVPYQTGDMPTVSAIDPERVDPGLAFAFYAGHVAQSLEPGLSASELVTDRAMAVYEAAAETCVGALMSRVVGAGLSFDEALQPDAIERLEAVLLRHYAYPTLDIRSPVFVGAGTADRLVDPRVQLRLVDDLCAAGTVVEANLYADADHIEAWLASLNDALDFAERARMGGLIEPDCDPVPILGP